MLPLTDILDKEKQTVLQDAAVNRKLAHVRELLSFAERAGSHGLATVPMKPFKQTVLIDVAMKCASVVTDATLYDADEGYLDEFIEIAKLLVERDQSKQLMKQADVSGWNAVHHCVPQENGAQVVAALVPQLAALCEFFISKGLLRKGAMSERAGRRAGVQTCDAVRDAALFAAAL